MKIKEKYLSPFALAVSIFALSYIWLKDHKPGVSQKEPDIAPQTEEPHNHIPNDKGLVLDMCLCLTTPEDEALEPTTASSQAEQELIDKKGTLTESFTSVSGQIPDQATTGYLFTAYKRADITFFHMRNLETNKECLIRKRTYDQFRRAYVGPEL